MTNQDMKREVAIRMMPLMMQSTARIMIAEAEALEKAANRIRSQADDLVRAAKEAE